MIVFIAYFIGATCVIPHEPQSVEQSSSLHITVPTSPTQSDYMVAEESSVITPVRPESNETVNSTITTTPVRASEIDDNVHCTVTVANTADAAAITTTPLFTSRGSTQTCGFRKRSSPNLSVKICSYL